MKAAVKSVRFKEVGKNGLLGYAQITFECGIKVHGVAVKEKIGKGRYLVFPFRKDGDKFFPVVEFETKAMFEEVSKEVLDAVSVQREIPNQNNANGG